MSKRYEILDGTKAAASKKHLNDGIITVRSVLSKTIDSHHSFSPILNDFPITPDRIGEFYRHLCKWSLPTTTSNLEM